MVTMNLLKTAALALVLGCCSATVAAAQDPKPKQDKPVTAQDTSIEGLTRHAAGTIEDKEVIVRDKSLTDGDKRAQEVIDRERAYFEQLIDQATTTSMDAIYSEAERYGLKAERRKPEKDTDRPVAGQSRLRYRMFISSSMGPAAIEQAVAYGVKYRDSMMLTYRGPKPGQTIQGMIRDLIKITGEQADESMVPNIEINPPEFTDNNVSDVPTLVKVDADGKPIASVRGLMNPEWLESEIEAGNKGDLGKRGPTSAIAEIDLMAAMIEKAKGMDINKMAEGARDRFWKNAPLIELPPAMQDRTRLVDGGFTVAQDIRLPDGRYLARKGEYHNDLKEMPFTRTVVVFDTTKPAQVALAKKVSQENSEKVVLLLASNVDREAGWGNYNALEDDLGRPLYVLTSDVVDRFKVEKVPTIVTADDRNFIVKEVAVSTQGVEVSADSDKAKRGDVPHRK